MSSALDVDVADLASREAQNRSRAAGNIYRLGCALSLNAVRGWLGDPELAGLLGKPVVGVAVPPKQFDAIREANGSPGLADVPPDQDALEFELHFSEGVALDILTSRDPGGTGAIARYLTRFGQGIQQVELPCGNVDRATDILRERFGIAPVYPAARRGADRTRINFFLVGIPGGGKVLIELYENPAEPADSQVNTR
jgi:hypothetical protein